MDEALWLPTEKSRAGSAAYPADHRLWFGVADTVDPLAGSYLIEYLTDQIEEEKADAYIRKIDELGGALKAIEQWLCLQRDTRCRIQRPAQT